jgi:hypothetical protein
MITIASVYQHYVAKFEERDALSKSRSKRRIRPPG